MKRFAFAMAAALAIGSVAVAQTGPAPGPIPGRGGRGMRMFDPATVTTVSGTVEAVDRIQRNRHQGIHVQLKAADGTVDVHLGPSFYVDNQPLKLAKGDAIEVTGSKVQLSGKPALIAQSVKKGDAVLTLRDASGVPVWAGQPAR